MNQLEWKLIRFKSASDIRGDLLAIELHEHLPFVPKRFFATYNVPVATVRGQHAHFECHQVLFALAGEFRVTLNNGFETEEFLLDDPALGLYVPKLNWGTQEALAESSILGVFASEVYLESDYIRNFNDFLKLVNKDSSNSRYLEM